MAPTHVSLPYFRRPTAPKPLAPVLCTDDPEDIKVERLARKDLKKAADTGRVAFADNPIAKYITDTPDAKPPPKDDPRAERFAKRVWRLIIYQGWKTKVPLTVNHGESILFATPPKEHRRRPTPGGVIASILLTILGVFGRAHLTPEQKRRSREVEWKIKHLIRSNLGKRVNDLIHIDLLATTPEKQGNGYGSALVKHIVKHASGYGIYLETYSTKNVEFYESFGFEVVDEVHLGEHNPTWHEKPVTVYLMVREANKDIGEKVPLLV